MDIKILAENMRRFGTKNLQEQDPATKSTEIGGVTFTPQEKKPTVGDKIQSKVQRAKSAFAEAGNNMLNSIKTILSKTMGFTFNLYSVAPGNLQTNGNKPMITGFTLNTMTFNNGKATFKIVCKNPLTSTSVQINARLDWDSNKPDQFTISSTQDLGLGSNPAVVYNEMFSKALMDEFNKLRNNPDADFAQNNAGTNPNNVA